jgi:ATP-dependent HslUV protease ATP-binding subunit HslU
MDTAEVTSVPVEPGAGGSGGAESEAGLAIDENLGLTPRQIVAELDRFIVGQQDAKKAVAIALRNRWRRQNVDDDLRDEIDPNNLILIGPTGVGKTEIARRLARLAGAPFVKVEASKFTEVGYVGRDVESMIRDLVDAAIAMVREEREEDVQEEAERRVEDRLLDLLLPPVDPGEEDRPGADPGTASGGPSAAPQEPSHIFVAGPGGVTAETLAGALEPESEPEPLTIQDRRLRTREKLRGLLRDGKMEDREIEMEVRQSANIEGMMIPMGGGEGMDHGFMEMLQDMLPKRTKTRSLTVGEARRLLMQEELDRLVDMDDVIAEAMMRAEESGIVFLDEIDKVAGGGGGQGPDVSREGVQRDLLPVVEGSNVSTKYGLVRTDHILFIAAGAFHVSRPSDLIPELQGRFPIRVELNSLGEKEFVRILTEPTNALTRQYSAMVATEGVELTFTADGIAEIARIAADLNDRMENIGARRLRTVLTTLLEEVMFGLPESGQTRVEVSGDFVTERLSGIVKDEDLTRYIL